MFSSSLLKREASSLPIFLRTLRSRLLLRHHMDVAELMLCKRVKGFYSFAKSRKIITYDNHNPFKSPFNQVIEDHEPNLFYFHFQKRYSNHRHLFFPPDQYLKPYKASLSDLEIVFNLSMVAIYKKGKDIFRKLPSFEIIESINKLTLNLVHLFN